MLQEVFYWLFNMSITATVTGGLIVAVRAFKKIPRRVAVWLWLVPFFRMTVPLGLNNPCSFMSLLSKITTKTVTVYESAGGAEFSMTNSIMAAETYFPITYKVNVLSDVFGAAAVIWSVVCIALALTLLITYAATLQETKAAVHLRDRLYLSDKITSPAVYGIFRPKIILPLSYQEQSTELIVLHETVHVRRAHNLWRMLAFLIAAVHWFNPFAWLFLKLFLEDLELSCDERVLTRIGANRAREYARVLLESHQPRSVFTSAFGGSKIRTRIENILSFRKMTWISLGASGILLIAIFCILLTNAG